MARGRRWLGGAILLALPVGAAAAILAPGIRGPVARIARTVVRDVLPDRDADVRLPAETTRGVEPGAAAFVEGSPRPVAHVVGVAPDALVLRFEPGADPKGPWTAHVYPPSRTLEEALALAVPAETAQALRRDLETRARRVWKEALRPETEARLPALLRRLDPANDPRSAKLLDEVGAAVLAQLEPLAQQLSDAVTQALDRKFDLLARMGLLWKFVRGDADGLKKEIVPVATETARAWWTAHQAEVFAALRRGVAAKGPEVEAWLTDEVLVAVQEELAAPVWEAGRARLEAEARSWLADAAREIALAPEGGFRLRFSAVLRHHLLDDASALVLLERTP